MTKTTSSPLAREKTTRRKFLKSTALGATGILAGGPWIIKDALSSSGELRMMMWSDYLPNDFVAGFEKTTGIKLHHLGYGSNEELINKTKAIRGRGYDLIGPTALRALQWQPLGLLQPFDMNRVEVDRYQADMLQRSLGPWTWEGKAFHLPFFWGTEGMSWLTTMWERRYEDLSYGDLWREEVKGRVMVRPHSMMLGVGLYLDRIGKLPSNRMLDAYKDEENMRRIWDEITTFAIEKKPNVKMFWNNSESLKSGFVENGVVLGQTWDGPAMALKNEGKPINYMAPREGALAWLDGLAMPVGAKNIDQIYAFLEYASRPEVAGMLASKTGYNPVVKGADNHLSSMAKKNFQQAYPQDALDKLWWWQPEAPWYAKIRAEYRDKYVTA